MDDATSQFDNTAPGSQASALPPSRSTSDLRSVVGAILLLEAPQDGHLADPSIAKEKLRAVSCSRKQVRDVEAKILAGKPLSKIDTSAIPLVLDRIEQSERILCALVRQPSCAQDTALQQLVRQTVSYAELLDALPAKKLIEIAADLKAFPMLVSAKTSRKRINERLLEVKLGHNYGRRYASGSRMTDDDFTHIATNVLQEVYSKPFPDLTLDEWNKDKPKLRETVFFHVFHDVILDELKPSIAAARDKKCKSRLRERVIQRVLDKCRAMVGLKAQR